MLGIIYMSPGTWLPQSWVSRDPRTVIAPEGPFSLQPSRPSPPVLQISKLICFPRRESNSLKGTWLGQSWELSPGFLRPGVCSLHDDQWLWVTKGWQGPTPTQYLEIRETMAVVTFGTHISKMGNERVSCDILNHSCLKPSTLSHQFLISLHPIFCSKLLLRLHLEVGMANSHSSEYGVYSNLALREDGGIPGSA